MPLTLTGVAVKRNPSVGSAPRLVRCSQIGMPAASKVECTGRAPFVVSAMLRVDADELRAAVAQVGRRIFGEKRVPLEVGIRTPAAIPSGVDEHRPAADVVGQQQGSINGPRRAAGDVDHHALECLTRRRARKIRVRTLHDAAVHNSTRSGSPRVSSSTSPRSTSSSSGSASSAAGRPAPGLRTRPPANGRPSSSRSPRRTVFSASPHARAAAAIPPYPNVRASDAANARR